MDETGSKKPEPISLGYCSPPEHSRFKKGKSGNPRGRPKGTLNLATVLQRTLRERVVINENGRRKTVTKLQAAVRQLVNKAACGEMKAVQLLTALVRLAEERSVQTDVPNSVFDEADEKVVAGILQRLEATNKGGQDDEPDG